VTNEEGDVNKDDIKDVLISEEELMKWSVACLMKAGADEGPARIMCNILLSADKRGHYSHGFNRLDIYYNDIANGIVKPNNEPVILNETTAAALVDGRDGLGGVVAEFSMDLAIKKAKASGIGWVTAKNSNHYGIAGHYAMMAEKVGLCGVSMTNGSPWVTATRSAGARVMSTNPISFTAPGKDGDSMVLDMATSCVAVGKLEVAAVNNSDIPAGWAVDGQGQVTTKPKTAMREGAGLPLGGQEETGGYKGYGLALMVEVLCGVMSGGTWGPNIRHWGRSDKPGGLSHCFLAFDPSVCVPQDGVEDGDPKNFSDRMQELMDTFRGLTPANEEKPVLIPGDPEKTREKNVERTRGVNYSGAQFRRFVQISDKFCVPPPKSLSG